MNKKIIRILIFFMSISLLGLIGIQVYWIDNAITVREQAFDKSVYESLNNVADILENIEVKKQLKIVISKSTPQDKLLSSDSLNNVLVNQAETLFYQIESSKKYNLNRNTKIEIQDTSPVKYNENYKLTKGLNKSLNQKSLNFKTEQTRKNEINKIINKQTKVLYNAIRELVVDNIFKKSEAELDPDVVDSVITNELSKKAIDADYVFAVQSIEDNGKIIIDRADKYKDTLLNSPYKVKLFPKNIFSNKDFLMIHFPNHKQYLLMTMWVVLLISAILIMVIVFGFTYTIYFIIHQRKVNEVKNDFINNITHEFKTPISTISLATEALTDKTISLPPERNEKFLNLIKDENKRLGILAEKVLQTALLEKGQLKFNFQIIDISKIINEVIKNIAIQAEQKNGKIITNLEATKIEILADKIHMTNMVYNLIDNAIKYTPKEPLIIVSTKDVDNGIYIIFEDNGIGISKSAQKKIFDKLFRVSTGNIHNVRGYGLGLSYVKAIVDKHHGNIKVDSEIGKGSKFTVFLPDSNSNTLLYERNKNIISRRRHKPWQFIKGIFRRKRV